MYLVNADMAATIDDYFNGCFSRVDLHGGTNMKDNALKSTMTLCKAKGGAPGKKSR